MITFNFILENKAYCIQRIIIPIQRKYWNFRNVLSSKLWGVNLGKSCRFMGKVVFRRSPNSRITIGNKNTFNSSKTSNLIGVYSPCIISTLNNNAIVEIGDNCGFSGTVIASAVHIRLGNSVRCGANTLITDTDWHTDDFRTGKDKEVIIDDNVWLGYGVKVLKGVHIGENSLVGANSVVTKDIPANVIAVGNPCKVIKSIRFL